MKVSKFLLFFILLVTVIVTSTSPAAPPKVKIPIGALLSITGGWPTLGNSSVAAVQIAAEDVNAYFNRIGVGLEVYIVLKDTKLDPNIALNKLKELARDGIRIVVGPQSSAEIANIRSFAEQNEILLLSQSSTAGSLSIAGDNIFRLTPDDKLEGEAISALMFDDGIRAIVPIWRDDAGNAGLEISTRDHFSEAGGSVLPGVKYATSTTDFSSQVDALESQVREALADRNQNTDQVAVYLAAFDEVASIFKLAASNSTLSSVRWYGSDGVALSQTLLADSDAAEFASQVNYPNPLPGLPAESSIVWRPIIKQIKQQTGAEPEAFALGVYDAIWIAAKTVALNPGAASPQFVKQHIRTVASTNFGATGWTILNKAGDRRFGNFDFWAIRNIDGSRQWVKIAAFNSSSKVLTHF